MANIKDVAKLAGVSITTVSMVLNDTDYKISENTKKKVRKAAKELSYKPNRMARALASKKSNLIMAVIPDILNPFFSSLVKDLSYYAEKNKYFLYIYNTNNRSMKKDDLFSMVKKNYIGATLLVDRNIKNISDEEVKENNIIFLDEVDFRDRKTNMVTGNNEEGGFLAMDYLLDRDFKKIGLLIGPSDTANSSRRLSGALKAAMNRDIYIDPELIVHGDYSYEGGYKAGSYFLSKKVEAIFSFSDMSSYGLLNYFREKKIRVPQDISLISYDNLYLNDIISPRLTSVDQRLDDIARESIKMAVGLIDKEKSYEKVLIRPVLVEGESVGKK